MWHNSLYKIKFYSLPKLKNKCFKIRNKSAECSKNTNLMPKTSLRCVLRTSMWHNICLKIEFHLFENKWAKASLKNTK